MGFPCGSAGKELACNAGDLGLTPGLEDPQEKGKATHSSILAWRISWTVSSMRSQGWTQVRDFHFHKRVHISGADNLGWGIQCRTQSLASLARTLTFVIYTSTFGFLSRGIELE